jgi:hypothetical protein
MTKPKAWPTSKRLTLCGFGCGIAYGLVTKYRLIWDGGDSFFKDVGGMFGADLGVARVGLRYRRMVDGSVFAVHFC